MKPAHLRMLLALGLAGTLALAWFAPRDENISAERPKHGRQANKVVQLGTVPAAAAIAARGQLASAELYTPGESPPGINLLLRD